MLVFLLLRTLLLVTGRKRRRRTPKSGIADLFQVAKDGILNLDSDNGAVIDANPFMSNLLGYTDQEFLGKELWEIGCLATAMKAGPPIVNSWRRATFANEHLPAESRSGHKVEVELVSNVYQEDQRRVIQCNIRDITERSRLQRLTEEQAASLADLDRRKDEFLAMLSHELAIPWADFECGSRTWSAQ